MTRVPSLRSQTSHDDASRSSSCQVVMGTVYPSPFCLVAPQESAVNLWSPPPPVHGWKGNQPLKRLLDNSRVRNRHLVSSPRKRRRSCSLLHVCGRREQTHLLLDWWDDVHLSGPCCRLAVWEASLFVRSPIWFCQDWCQFLYFFFSFCRMIDTS